MFVPTRLAKRMFFQLNSKQKVCSSRRIYIAPFLSQSNKTLPNTCFASELYSLIHGLFGNFPVGLISWVHFNMHQQKQLSLASTDLALFQAATTLSSKKQNITSINNRSTSRSNSHQIAGRCSSQESQQTQQRSKKSYQFTTYSPKLYIMWWNKQIWCWRLHYFNPKVRCALEQLAGLWKWQNC